jgi:hypothetical protein
MMTNPSNERDIAASAYNQSIHNNEYPKSPVNFIFDPDAKQTLLEYFKKYE